METAGVVEGRIVIEDLVLLVEDLVVAEKTGEVGFIDGGRGRSLGLDLADFGGVVFGGGLEGAVETGEVLRPGGEDE